MLLFTFFVIQSFEMTLFQYLKNLNCEMPLWIFGKIRALMVPKWWATSVNFRLLTIDFITTLCCEAEKRFLSKPHSVMKLFHLRTWKNDKPNPAKFPNVPEIDLNSKEPPTTVGLSSWIAGLKNSWRSKMLLYHYLTVYTLINNRLQHSVYNSKCIKKIIKLQHFIGNNNVEVKNFSCQDLYIHLYF